MPYRIKRGAYGFRLRQKTIRRRRMSDWEIKRFITQTEKDFQEALSKPEPKRKKFLGLF